MKIKLFFLFICCLIAAGTVFALHPEILPSPNGIMIPEGYKNWPVIASSHRTDNNTLRVILGNSTAVMAAKTGQTNPWPKGTILAKIVWKDRAHEKWSTATIPGRFVHAEFMIKDPEKYASTGGWGFARWLGMDLMPYGNDAGFAKECFGCHQPVKDNDYVFTQPAEMP